jgi:membrane protease YdiL (CAAX protease family)
MRESARYAWWLLIFLFMLIILGNIAFFWTLFFQPGGKGLASSNQPLGVEFQVRYALAMERFGLGEETTRSVLQSAFEGMEKAFSPYEAAVYRLIVQSAFSAGDPKETLRLLPDLPSERLTAVQRRWQAVRLRDALTRPIAPSQVPTVVDSLGALPSPLARELLEITLYQRAGAADKARALREALAQRAAWGAVLFGAVLGAGCFAGLAGIGILLWYLLARLPLPKRPAPNESPFAYDPLLWALVIFLLVLLNAPVIRETLRGVEASNALYLLAVLLPLMYLLSLRRESDALGQLRWFQGSVWKQVGVALMGYAAYVPFLAVLLCLTVLIAPALPSEQTNPISERVFENQGAWEWLWTFVQAAVLAPIIEEFVFRGVLFQVFWQRTGRVWLSAFASGYLFAVIHPQFLGGILPITVLGTVLALVYAHTRSLLPCILIHALNNGLIVLMLWSVAG